MVPSLLGRPFLLCCHFLSFVCFEWPPYGRRREDLLPFHHWLFYIVLMWEHMAAASTLCLLVSPAFRLFCELSPTFPASVNSSKQSNNTVYTTALVPFEVKGEWKWRDERPHPLGQLSAVNSTLSWENNYIHINFWSEVVPYCIAGNFRMVQILVYFVRACCVRKLKLRKLEC